jgi:NAD(P)-dependent dehydrogenase (short-subunit alcohol dehydrogenase family)
VSGDRQTGRGPGKVVVVTGAGSGIGRALAIGLARRGARLAICDVDGPGLEITRLRTEALGAPAVVATVDVAERMSVAAFATQVAEHYGVVHQVYNNAGVAGGRRLLDDSYDGIERVLRINLWGVVYGTKEFLPHLIASGDGHLVNISSVNGFLAQPGLTSYCAAKFAVRGFTETVRAEMLADALPVKVTVVHPGGVRTNIATAAFEHARGKGEALGTRDEQRMDFYNEKLLRMEPADAAEIILTGVAAGRPRILVGASARRLDRLTRLLPAAGPAITAWFDRHIAATEERGD